jgi:drug/metabolite transporter (DMT)-like permease
VFIWGFTAVLGKYVPLPAIEIVWFRMLIAVVFFVILLGIKKIPFCVPPKDLLKFLGTGLVVALHWICFFGAIKLSNISVTLGTMATASLFAAFLEPIFYRKKFTFLDIVASLIIISGLYIIFQFEFHYLTGILVALASAFLAALFTVINKGLVAKSNPVVISMYEMAGGFIGISVFVIASPVTFFTELNMDLFEWGSLIVLGTICTGYAFAVSVKVMKNLSAYYVTLSVNMEPVYGIILAFIFFAETEQMSGPFYFGAFIILSTVVVYPLINRRINKQHMKKLSSR